MLATARRAPEGDATFGMGRMVNGVGGSITHYGAWLRRFHPHHFRMRSHIVERNGEGVLPRHATLADWPVGYDELEPYYTQIEQEIGVAGDGAENPFLPRSKPLPMPSLRPFKLGERFRQVTHAMGLHPYSVPVGQNSIPFDGRPATEYSPWSAGFGAPLGDRWDPSLSHIPEALATGNLDLRTHCRVLRVLTDADGHADGVEYLDANGQVQTQRARTVILCSYTFENIRLLFLSADARHPAGLGNNRGQLGKHYLTKMSTAVGGYFPGEVWNRHAGPASQGVLIDDFLSADFDGAPHGFVGGASPGVEMQTGPLRICRETIRPGVPAWGHLYKESLRDWQPIAFIGIQQDTLSYATTYLDLSPRRRERSGLGLPVVRLTHDLQTNEQRMAAHMEDWGMETLRAMGASEVWNGMRSTNVITCHDLGGARMGDDPATSVLGRDLQVHDTPGLHVFGGAAFPSCPGINPTLTIFALCRHAVDAMLAAG
ncbi:MAG: GMC family oxidoreductase [Caldilineaceae bacterium]|nr:GMC family oxidoreductase [Caldilineaceae bacterium]